MKPSHISAVFALAVTGFLLSAGITPAQDAKIDHARIARETLEKHIQPGYQRMTAAFDRLGGAVSDLCRGAGTLDDTRARFIKAVETWGAMAHFHFGPIRADNHYERIWFWPDRRSIGQRQVLSALRNKPEDYTDQAELAGKSIAVQGLGAMELVLYGSATENMTDDAGQPAFACRYAEAIAANLKAIAVRVEADWQIDGAFGRIWLNPGPDNRNFLRDRETTFTLIRAFMENVERVRDVELARPLGVTQSRRRLPGPFDKSRATMIFIAARIAGLHALVQSGLAGEMTRAAEAAGDVQSVGDIKQGLFELAFAERRAKELAAIPDILGESPRRSEAAPLGFPLKSARFALGNAAGRLTKLPMGYNASDGD